MLLAFRLFGNFHWPPVAGRAPEKPATQAGAVEIHFATKPGGAAKTALLRWCPGRVESGDGDPAPGADTPSLFDKTQEEALAWFIDRRTSGGIIWLDGAGAPQIAFRGAFLLQQFADPQGFDCPLVPQVKYHTDSTTHSALVLYRHLKPLFRFNLHLPLPVMRRVKSGKYTEAPAFPFCAVYPAVRAASEDPFSPEDLVAGWIERDATADTNEPNTVQSYVLEAAERPRDRRLGKFGFATQRDTGRYFAELKGQTGSKPVPIDRLWPANLKPSAAQILANYGFSISGNGAEVGLPGKTPTAISLRFEKNRLIYRVEIPSGFAAPGSDLTASGGGLQLKLATELGGPVVNDVHYSAAARRVATLAVGKTVLLDCELAWKIDPGKIWPPQPPVDADNPHTPLHQVDDGRDWGANVKLRLSWREKVDTIAAQAASTATPLPMGLLPVANHSTAATRKALIAGEAGMPHSFLPDIAGDNKPTVFFCLYGSPVEAAFDSHGVVSWGKSTDQKGWSRPPMRLTLAAESDLIAKLEKQEWLDVKLTAISFFQTPEVTLRATLDHDPAWPPSEGAELRDSSNYFASYRLKFTRIETRGEGAWRGRLGALQFSGKSAGIDPGSDRGHLRIGQEGVGRAGDLSALVYPQGSAAVEIKLWIPAAQIDQITADVARGDRSGRPGPLLIPLPLADGARSEAMPYWLTTTERLAPRQDRWLEADVYDLSGAAEDGAGRSYVLLSQEPFSVLKFTHAPLGARGDAASTSVATYSGDTRLWQYKVVSQHYHYVLPPQAIGESADKPRRLEIHDLPSDSAEKPARPYVQEKYEGDPEGMPPDFRRRAVDFRLTPSAEFWITPSDVERGYFVPESTSYEIFRQRGEYGLGAQLSYLRAEFLYGMPVGIDVSKETGIARGARVAEIEALTGRLAGPGGTSAATDQLNRWAALRGAVARRPERLEIWACDLDSTVAFTPARFSDGARFALRGTALHRHPIGPDGEVTSTPLVGGEAPQGPVADKPRHHPHGLSGGAIWPVESNNLFETLVASPASKGGVIERIALSPTGGDAAQKAEFLNGKVTIISETYNGQVQRQQVEVLGRIGALWHRAKHVVVYERTVNASAQFAPLLEEDPHKTRTRRPVLRKVREYVELLQPERSYPDFTNVEQRSSGFLERVRFNSRIINVDSAWGTDVGDFGWKVPLWNRLSSRQRPQVYPMPDIAFVSTAEGEGERPVVSQECLDADFLYFFADFKATTSDTDLWASRLGIDFPNMPASVRISQFIDAASQEPKQQDDEYVEGRRRSVGRFLPGLRQFTWRLAPAARKTALNAGRGAKPVFVGLETVSFMRATHSDNQALHADLVTVVGNAEHFKRNSDAARRLAGVAYWRADGAGAEFVNKDVFEKFAGQAGELTKAIERKDPAAVKALLADLQSTDPNKLGWKDVRPKLAGYLVGLVDQGDLTQFGNVISVFKGGGAFCDKLKQDAVNMVKRKEMLLRTAVQDAVGNGMVFLGELPINKAKLAEEISKEALRRIRPILTEASADIGKLDEGVEQARSMLLDLEAEIETVFDRARQRIEQFVAGYEHDKPWSEDRRKAFRNGLSAALSSVADDVAASIDEIRQRLGVELSGAAQAVGGHIARLLAEAAEARLKASNIVTSVGAAVDDLVPAIEQSLADLATQIGSPPQSKIDALIGKAAGIKDTDIREKVVGALETIKAARAGALDKISQARAFAIGVDAAADQALESVDQAMARMLASLSELGGSLTTHVDDVAEELATIAADIGAEIEVEFRTLIVERIGGELRRVADFIEGPFSRIGSAIDSAVIPAGASVERLRGDLLREIRRIPAAALPVIADVRAALSSAQHALSPEALVESLIGKSVIEPAVTRLLQPLPGTIGEKDLKLARARLLQFEELVGGVIRELNAVTLGTLAELSSACSAVYEGVEEAARRLQEMATGFQGFLEAELDKAYANFLAALGPLPDIIEDAEKLLGALKSFDYSVRRLQNDLSRSFETAGAYADRVLDLAGKLDQGGLMAVPSNVLKLYSAVTSAPEIAALKADIDRIRSGFDEFSDIIETTKANALFNRLGDELKGLGLSLPFDKIGDRILPADLGSFDIGKVFRNFGGAKLDRLFKGYKIPAGMREAVKITHDFDKKQARAWVQVDINAPMPGRRSLFSIGVFKADFVDMHLVGRVRLEVSKDQDKVTQTGFGRIGTKIDMVAGGQSMVCFNNFGLSFTREKGLDIEFDPSNIRLNPQFKFIQDFLSTLFGGDPGGLSTITEGGLPVGIEHLFAIPPLSLNFGTSGVQNVSIENRFKLVAYPDFMLADRFNLSTIERPFIFAIFIIGGTGYIQLEAQYCPFDSELMVLVEAGAGGSASLAFAFGPFSGQVFITLSGTLSYRKLIGKPGGGLAISMVLVIAGHVNVAGIVTVGITLMLRMTYRDSGQIDADGTLAVTIRISRFFKLTARANAKYKLRGGKSETQVTTSVESEELKKLEKAKQVVDKLEKARN
jgi:flagellin-like hook-associated protein FlgL